MVNESVLVVPRSSIFPQAAPQGFIGQDIHVYLGRMESNYRFEPRALVENDPSLKQLIPYVVLTCRDNVFVVKRSSLQSEQRLAGMHSIGIGGHINTTDVQQRKGPSVDASGIGSEFMAILREGLLREIKEEVCLAEVPELSLKGLINDDSNSVGSVHLGLVYIARLQAANIAIREKDMMSGSFVPVADLGRYYDSMETWSQIVIDSGCLEAL